MLTLKVFTTDHLGNKVTHVMTGDRIEHREYKETDRKKKYDYLVLGAIEEDVATQTPFTVSIVKLTDNEFSQEVLILPQADCYIMESGRTVDYFICAFE